MASIFENKIKTIRYLPKKTGFTLMEMVIGIVILLIIINGTYRIFKGVTTAIQREESRLAVYRSARLALDKLAKEIQACFVTPWPLVRFYGYNFPDTTKENSKGDELFFVSFIPSKEGSDVCEIGYWLMQEGNSYIFMRHFEKAPPDRLGPDYDFGTSDVDTRLVENIIGLDFRYYYKDVWLDSWDSGVNRNLPQVVEITLKFPKKELKSLVYLPLGEEYE